MGKWGLRGMSFITQAVDSDTRVVHSPLFPSSPLSSLIPSSLPFSSLPFPFLPFPFLSFPFLPFPSLPFPSLPPDSSQYPLQVLARASTSPLRPQVRLLLLLQRPSYCIFNDTRATLEYRVLAPEPEPDDPQLCQVHTVRHSASAPATLRLCTPACRWLPA